MPGVLVKKRTYYRLYSDFRTYAAKCAYTLTEAERINKYNMRNRMLVLTITILSTQFFYELTVCTYIYT